MINGHWQRVPANRTATGNERRPTVGLWKGGAWSNCDDDSVQSVLLLVFFWVTGRVSGIWVQLTY